MSDEMDRIMAALDKQEMTQRRKRALPVVKDLVESVGVPYLTRLVARVAEAHVKAEPLYFQHMARWSKYLRMASRQMIEEVYEKHGRIRKVKS